MSLFVFQISGRSSLQWRMLLDVYDRDLHMTHNEASMSDLGYMFYGGKKLKSASYYNFQLLLHYSILLRLLIHQF